MNRRRLTIIGTTLILALLFTGCASDYATYTPSAADLTMIAQELPEGPTKEMIVGTAVSRYLKQSRGKKAQEMFKKPKIKKMIKETAKEIMQGKKMKFCPLCKKIRNVEKCGD